jgi:hypothetical protein
VRILVAGKSGNEPGHGGADWAIRQYVLGLQRLGHDVVLSLSADGSFDVVLNTSGLLSPDSIATIPIRIYLDLDPAFNQLWHQFGIDRRFEGHTHFVTVGLAIGEADCDVPTDRREWIRTLPPVVLEHWPCGHEIELDAMTTVANFRSYGSVEQNGVHYGQKVHSLRELVGLPMRVPEKFVMAMRVHPDEHNDAAALTANGWELADPYVVAATPDAYRRFIQGSRAEIAITKKGYVTSACAWFSDRSACYLASGRPVVAQDTGFSKYVPTGAGLFAFADEDGAVAAIEEIRGDYSRHSRVARSIAEEYFDSDRVLTRLLERVGA